MIDCLECKTYKKGDYIFRKGDRPDVAYVVLYGRVEFLDVSQAASFIGKEPESPDNKGRASGLNKQTSTYITEDPN